MSDMEQLLRSNPKLVKCVNNLYALVEEKDTEIERLKKPNIDNLTNAGVLVENSGAAWLSESTYKTLQKEARIGCLSKAVVDAARDAYEHEGRFGSMAKLGASLADLDKARKELGD